MLKSLNMRKSKFKEPKAVLIFSSTRYLMAIAGSLNQARLLVGKSNAQPLSECCRGRIVMSGNFYYRYLHPNVEISIEEDLGKLDLIEYDKMCGWNASIIVKMWLSLAGVKGREN